MEKLQKQMENFLEKKVSLLSWSGSFLGIIFLRVFIEQFIGKSAPADAFALVVEYLHNFFFFLLSFISIWLFLSFILDVNPKKLTPIFLWAQFLILFPPLLDMLKTGGSVYWSFYLLGNVSELFGNWITIFGQMPSGIRYFGTKIVFLLAVSICSGVVFLKTKKVWKTGLAALGVYSIFFVLGSFPTLFTYGYLYLFEGKSIFSVQSFNVAQFFASPLPIFGIKYLDLRSAFPYKLNVIYFLFSTVLLSGFFFRVSREKFWAVIKNFRFPQLVYHSGLFFMGMGLGYLEFPENFRLSIFSFFSVLTLLASTWLAWKASVVVNDIYDIEIDKITNKNRPLPSGIFSLEDYREFGIAVFILSLIGGLTIGFSFFFLLLTYQLLAWFYSAKPFRLKRFLGAATFLSSLASLMILFLGYILLSHDQTITNLSWRIILLLIIAYTLSLPVKDFKDIEGDKKDGVWTLPVLFGEKKGRLIVATNLFGSYILSVFFLNELRLFFWALLFGALTFLAITREKTKPREIPGFVLVLATIYGLILVKIVFT